MTDAPKPGPAEMRFRLHRGSLAESMNTMRTFRYRAEFVHFLRGWAGLHASPSDEIFLAQLGFVLYGDGPDERIGWERTYLVTLAGSPVGFSDRVPGDIPEKAAPEPAPLIESRPEMVYDAVQRPINANHVSMNADGTFTLSYVKPEPEEDEDTPAKLRAELEERLPSMRASPVDVTGLQPQPWRRLGGHRKGPRPPRPTTKGGSVSRLRQVLSSVLGLLREETDDCIKREEWRRDSREAGDRRDWDWADRLGDDPPSPCGTCRPCRRRALLARIDSARKAG